MDGPEKQHPAALHGLFPLPHALSESKSGEAPFWNEPLDQLIARTGARPEAGLSAAEAQERLARYGRNTATDVPRQPLWLQFLNRFRNPLIILLIIASCLSAATGDRISFYIIVSMVMLSVILDFIQQTRAENTIDALRASVALKALVRRDGREAEIPMLEVVPGDIIRLSPGDLIPADGRLIEAKDLYVNQALLTGESFPVEKAAGHIARPSQDLNDAANSVFMGTSAVSGYGLMLALNTGKRSRLGALAGMLAKRRPPTAFERGVEDFGIMIMKLAFGMVLFVLLVNLGFRRPMLESFLFALALAVGLTPELLPMLVTVTLSRGAARMAKKRVIVKHLPAMHNLGAMDILCTDKTGTLTEANIRLVSALDASARESPRVFELAYINSKFETGVKSPLDHAILDHAAPDISSWQKLDEVPFDFERRRVSVLAANGDERSLIVKGAPEDILKLSTHYEQGGAIRPFEDALRQKCLETFERCGEKGLRVLAVATRKVDAAHKTAVVTDETDLTFAGFVTFLDPPKSSASEALRKLKEAGVDVRVITGDNERVTRHICDMIGFPAGDILTGDMIAGLSPEAQSAQIENARVFCRVNPQQKQHIIMTLKARGHSVGFLGDGINDAPALHAADVGVSVDSATDVAKSAADVILLENDLSVIYDGVVEGRRAVRNTEKYILMDSSSNFGNMFSMAGAALILPFLPMLPVQILLNNLLYDLSQTALPFDDVDTDALLKPVRWKVSRIRHFMWILGPVSSLFDFLTFYVLLVMFPGDAVSFHTGWFVESIVTQVLIVLSIRTQKFMLKSRPRPSLVKMMSAVAAIGIALPFTPVGAWFQMKPLPPVFFVFLVAALALYLALVEASKHLFRKQLAED